MGSMFGDTEEVREKQLNRLLNCKSKMRSYIVKEQAEGMIEYARTKGITLKLSHYNGWNIVEVV